MTVLTPARISPALVESLKLPRKLQIEQGSLADGGYSDIILSQSPSLYWRFEETSGTTALDRSGHGWSGTYTGTFTLGKQGAIFLDNGLSVYIKTDGRVNSSFNPFINGQGFSFSGWVYLNAAQQSTIWGGTDPTVGPSLRTEGSTYPANMTFANNANNTFTAVWPAAFQWVHCGFTFDEVNDTASVYINGALAQTLTGVTAQWPSSPGTFEAGCRRGTTSPMDGFMNEYAVWAGRLLSAAEFKAQYDAGCPPKDASGGQAAIPLSFRAPDTTGYTVRTVTAEEAQADPSRQTTGPLDLILSDSVDYVVKVPYTMRRGLRLNGGRNVVLQGAHIKIENQNRFNPDIAGLHIADGPAAVDRIVNCEGVWIEGADLGEGIDTLAPHADIRLGYFMVDNPHFRSSDAFNGTQMYQEGTNHPDGIQTFGDFKSLLIERSTFTYMVTALHFDQTSSSKARVRNVNCRVSPYVTVEEGPYTDTLAWATMVNQYDFEASIGLWAAAGGSTVTRDTATPITGVGSMKITQTTTNKSIYAVASGLGGLDFSSGNGLGFLARLDAGGGAHPMIRIDVATDNAATTTSSVGWHKGKSRKLTNGVAVQVFSDFPNTVLQAVQRLRIVLITDGVSATHTVMIDDIAEGNGQVINTFTGPPTTWEGQWSLYHNDLTAGELDIDGLWSSSSVNGFYVDNNLYNVRSWNGSTYVLDPPPGTAGPEDAVLGANGMGQPNTTGTDDNGAYVSWSATGDLMDAAGAYPGRVYTGNPPGGDFCTSSVAGANYLPTPSIQAAANLTGTSTTTSSITRQTGKILSATATTTASITKQVAKSITATATSTASITKQVAKTLSATVTTTASLLAQKVILKTLTATVTTTASIVKQVGKSLSATSTTTASIVRQVNKALSATSTTTATITRRVGKALTATATTTATVTNRVSKTLSATATSTASMVRQTGKLLTATATSSASITKRVGKTLQATVSSIGSLIASLIPGLGSHPGTVALSITAANPLTLTTTAASTVSMQEGSANSVTITFSAN